MSILKYRGEIIKHLLLIGVALFVTYIGTTFSCARLDRGFSRMDPALPARTTVLLDHSNARRAHFKIDDLICFRNQQVPNQPAWAGRVFALPGETVEITNGKAVVGDEPRQSASKRALEGLAIPRIMVPSGYLFVVYDVPAGAEALQRDHLVPVSSVLGHISTVFSMEGLWQ